MALHNQHAQAKQLRLNARTVWTTEPTSHDTGTVPVSDIGYYSGTGTGNATGFQHPLSQDIAPHDQI